MTSYNQDGVFYDARAKIMWGEPKEDVRKFLETTDLMDFEIDQMLNDLYAERASEIRSNGMSKLIKWSAAFVGCAILALVFFGIFPIKVIALFVLGALVSGWRAFDGLSMLLEGGKREGCMTSMVD